jgi:hypothetical protein
MVVILVVGGLVGLASTEHLFLGSASENATNRAASQTGDAMPVRIPAQQGISVKTCIDPTASTDKRFAQAIRASLVEAVRGYMPSRPEETKAGVAGTPGLDLTVRLISTRPLAYGEPYLHIEIPPVDGLPPRPDMTKPGALDPGGPYLAWKKVEAQWAADYRAAQTAQADAVEVLQRIDLSHPQRSGVRDCVAALMTVPATYPDATVVVASDLGDNEFTGTDPVFNGAPMLIIQPCPKGDAGTCAARLEAFTSWTSAHGAGPVSLARPEAGDVALTQLISSNQ